jgi:nucleotidyltransferase/DNA polymerase involved in DNA repair
MTSLSAVCCWIPLFALRCEEERRPGSSAHPWALVAPEDARHVWQVSALARAAGVKAGLTVSQAAGLCPTITLCEPDPVYYDAQFAKLLAALNAVSPVIEPAELGRVYVGMDGLEQLHGSPEEQIEMVQCVVRGAWALTASTENPVRTAGNHAPRTTHRLGWGKGKFVSWVAATRARPGSAVIVPPGEEGRFLASQPLAVLSLDPDTYRRLRQLGLRTLGDLTALPQEAVVSQFGRAGRRMWRLAAGALTESIEGRASPEPIVVALTFFTPVADLRMLVQTLEQLIERALKHPRRSGWRVRLVRARAELEHGASWVLEALLKEPSADRQRIIAPLKTRLEQAPPTKAVERLTVEFAAFAPGTTALQLFARDAGAAARAGRRRALRNATREIALRLRRPMLYRVVPVQPWSRIPERRYALVDYEL